MKKITFAIDCDEVLRCLLDGMVELYNKEFGTNMKKEDITDFVVEKSFPLIEEETPFRASDWFFQYHGEDLFRKSPAFNGIKEDIERLRKYGNVVIVTYQKSINNKLDTLMWLDEKGIASDGICFIKDKTLVHADWIIDDNDWNFRGCNCKNGVLITAPYNVNKTTLEVKMTSNCRSIIRMDSLHEFVEWFEKEGYPEQASIDACYEVEKVLENVKDTLEEEFDMIEESSDGLPKNDVYYRVTGHLTSLLDEVSGRLFRMKEEPYFKK